MQEGIEEKPETVCMGFQVPSKEDYNNGEWEEE